MGSLAMSSPASSGRSSNPDGAAEYWIVQLKHNDTTELVARVWFHFTGIRFFLQE